ncbi:MAG TPA: hypothetical protein VL123_02945 [Candidatus Udaeobacter sp.]|jgi:hypothetical protein|nr:hypothetical protein [Candidatus Udaeobacter sp.]
MIRARPSRILVIAAALAAMVHRRACAQDFDGPDHAGPSVSPALWIERGLPDGDAGWRLDLVGIAWNGLEDFTTRSLAIGGGGGPLRLAIGVASTGDAEIGWNSAAAATGFISPRCGGALRAIARRDRSIPVSEPGAGIESRPIGIECGAGFWSAIGSHSRLWASLPALYGAGEAAPLDRGLETGIVGGARDVSAWLAWSAPAHAADQGERTAGVEIATGPAAIWVEARDRPFRAAIGVHAHHRGFEVAAEVTEHPVLGETLRLALTLERVRSASEPER